MAEWPKMPDGEDVPLYVPDFVGVPEKIVGVFVAVFCSLVDMVPLIATVAILVGVAIISHGCLKVEPFHVDFVVDWSKEDPEIAAMAEECLEDGELTRAEYDKIRKAHEQREKKIALEKLANQTKDAKQRIKEAKLKHLAVEIEQFRKLYPNLAEGMTTEQLLHEVAADHE